MNADAICWDDLLRANREGDLQCHSEPSMVPGDQCDCFAGRARGLVEPGCPNLRWIYNPGPTAREDTGSAR